MAPYRSLFEKKIATDLEERGIRFEYETVRVRFIKPAEHKVYRPDFILKTTSGKEIMIEAKGLFDASDRKKMVLVKEQNPGLDIRFVFQTPNLKIYPRSKTTVSQWAEQNGFMWSSKTVPEKWLKEA